MRIIDEKGRLFGRINIIDFLVIVFLCSLLPMFYYSYKLLSAKKPAPPPKEYLEMEISCNFIKISPSTLALISVGDQEQDAQGKSTGRIIWMGEPKPNSYKVDLGEGEIRIVNDPLLKELPVKIVLRVERRENKIYSKDRAIQIGTLFGFSTNKYSVSCVPIKSCPTKWIKIKVKFPGLSPELSKMINAGHYEKNDEGKLIARLIGIISSSSSVLSVARVDQEKLVFINDPSRNDIIVSLDVFCDEKDGNLFFKNSPVKLNGQITFNSNLYVVSGTIVGIDGYNGN